jgi:hypothetical protein
LEVRYVEDVWSEMTSLFVVQVREEPARKQLSCSEEVGGDVSPCVHPEVRVEAWEGGLSDGLSDVDCSVIVPFNGEAFDVWVFTVAAEHVSS